jgi:F0F1-type ATP synthase assembly protein I
VGQDPGWQRGLKEAAPYLSIGMQLAGTMVVYVGLGWLVDHWLDTTPAFLIVGGVLGMIAFFVQLLRVTHGLSASQKKRSKGKGGEPSD